MSETDNFDLVVIGAGPGGYVAALRAAQLGLRTACVEKDLTLGGTCLNVGCIPSKALLQSSALFAQAGKDFKTHGIGVGELSLDLGAMMKRKDRVVTTLTRGVAGLLKKAGVEAVQGSASLLGSGKCLVSGADGSRTLSAKTILIASGSVPIELPSLPFDGVRIVDSTAALELESVPERLLVVGAGAIGLEMGSVWARLGSAVTVVEMTDGIASGMDAEMSKVLQKSLKKQGLKFLLETSVQSAEPTESGITATLGKKDGSTESLEADVVLVAVGRRAYADSLGLANAGVEIDDRGRIPVDANFQTNVPGVFAIGDVIAGPMLAHKAEEEGVACVELLAGKAGHVSYETIPAVVYTHPEFASVGLTSEAAAAQGIATNIGLSPFAANGRAKTMGETEGAVKIIADASTDRILGVHIVGPEASALIAEAAVAMEMGASSEDLARSVHAHPTLPEAVKEAALAVDGRALHM
ncbi:MAG: dihydrolipoyl dehydrogenase [Candidatus Binatia bacterium]|nr:dihydrolipoyl dehydrogenase [Candidatus Binatia bacterium]MDG1959946.1 dihydrolipoyl dehydrogenase [Candidatus Binatia bacterium]MDG2009993.1 dihydrolipoyl dehydrogenase [Candidatus Binatia bacterium]